MTTLTAKYLYSKACKFRLENKGWNNGQLPVSMNISLEYIVIGHFDDSYNFYITRANTFFSPSYFIELAAFLKAYEVA